MANDNGTVVIEYDRTEVNPVYGGHNVKVTYIMTHSRNGRHNKYRVVCQVEGLRSRDPHLFSESAEFIGDIERDSNDETLTDQGAIALFDEYLP